MYDVIIPATKKNIPILRISLPYIRKNLDYDNIIIVANNRDFSELSEFDISIVDENSIYEGLSYKAISKKLSDICGNGQRAGWYLQQFIKMSWSIKTEKKYYVVFDADTIPLRPINYINQDGKYILPQKREYHKPYFDTINVIFNGKIKRESPSSFIAENMIIDSSVMREMIDEIESNTNLRGHSFYEKILYAVSHDDIMNSGFSEFETYGNFILNRYSNRICLRKAKSFRESMQIIGSNPTPEQLEWAAVDYDIISIEASDYPDTFLTSCTRKKLFRKMFSMKVVASFRTRLRSLYRKMAHKEDYLFD